MRHARRIAPLTLLLVVAACGLPPSGRQTTADPSTVPFGLLQPSPAGTLAPHPGGVTAHVFLVTHGHLVQVTRRVVGQNPAAAAVRTLLLGPTATEATHGLTSDLPAETRLVSLDLTGTTAAADLSQQFGTVGGTTQVLAVAQIVYTLTASPYIDSVRFAINGRRIEVPNATGSLSFSPRGRNDYSRLAPP